MEINTILVYHFADPDLGLEVFFGKEGKGQENKGVVDFEIRDWGTCCTLILGFEENFIQGVPAFEFFCMCDKKITFWKLSWVCTFIPGLLNSFDMPNFVLGISEYV